MDEALKCKESKEKKVILFNLSGHGHFDMQAYSDYFSGNLKDFEYPAEEVEKNLQKIPKI